VAQLLEQIAHACPLFKCKELLPLWTPSPFSTSSGCGAKHHSSTPTLLSDRFIQLTTLFGADRQRLVMRA